MSPRWWRTLVVGAVGAALLAAPIRPANSSAVSSGTLDGVEAGYLGCVAPRFSFAACIVSYRVDGGVRVLVLANSRELVAGVPVLTSYTEDAIAPSSALVISGDPGFPIVTLNATLPRTGVISLRARTAWTPPGYVQDSEQCFPYNGPLHYVIASDTVNRDVSEAWVEGTVGAATVRWSDNDYCGGTYGAFFTGPSSGAWALPHPLDESLSED